VSADCGKEPLNRGYLFAAKFPLRFMAAAISLSTLAQVEGGHFGVDTGEQKVV
jgi:hypothetical protein